MQIPIIQVESWFPSFPHQLGPKVGPHWLYNKKTGRSGEPKTAVKNRQRQFLQVSAMFCKLPGGEGSHSSLPGIALNNKMILRSRKNINPVTFVQFQNKPSQIIATWEDLAATCCWPSLYFKLDIFVSSFWPWWVGAKVGFVCLELLLEFHWDDPQASRKKLGTMIHSKSGKSKMYKYKNIPITFMRVCYSSYPNLWSPRLPGRSYNLITTSNEPALAVIYQASTSALAARLSCQLFFLRPLDHRAKSGHHLRLDVLPAAPSDRW